MRILTIVFILFLFSFSAAQNHPLTILHWNDFHSQNLPFPVKTKNRTTNTDTTFFVGGSAAFASYLSAHRSASSSVLVLNAGDDFQGSPVSAITQGKSQIELMTLLNPDAMQLGNHEFDYGRELLRTYLSAVPFPVLGANIHDHRSGTSFGLPYTMKTVGSITVAIIGLMSPELLTLSLPDNVKDLEVQNLAATVNALIPQLKQQKADIIVALTHAGVWEDSVLALHAPDLDLIVGGHSHTPLFRPKRVNGILITQAGSRGRWLGKIELAVNTDLDTVVAANAELIECRTADVTPDPVVAAKVKSLENLAAKELDEAIGELSVDWKREGRSESNIGNWIADAMRLYAKTDIAVQNSGGIRKEMLAGTIRVRDMWEISPFGNTLVIISVNGETLRRMVQHQLTINDDFCQVSGVSIIYRNVNGKRLLYNLKVNNHLVKDEQQYSIVTNNYVAAQSKKYFGIELSSAEITPLNVIDRDVLIEQVKRQKVVSSRVEGRIKETEE